MINSDYDRDPIMIQHFLYVGDTVVYKGKEEKVESITTIENSALDGTPVAVIPWISRGLFTMTLSNGHWAYGDQIQKKE